jgi:NADPH:quinone reductase-like Zn-dependent oxidoreductase
MKAIRIHNYGHSDKLNSEEIPVPKINEDQVLAKIHDAGVNPIDWKLREGQIKDMRPINFPQTVGQDFAGEISEVGAKVSKFKVGDHVFGFAQGAYAEFAAISVDKLAMIPESLDFINAASLPTPGLTAYQILTDAIQIKPNDKILIHGAAGSVGSFLVQIAKHLGAEVIASASAEDSDYLSRIGAHHLIDYKKQKFQEIVKDLDAVVDLIGGETAKKSYQVVKKGGILVSTVGAVDQKEGDKFGIRTNAFVMKPEAGGLEKLAELVEQGAINPRIDRIVPYDQFREAQDLVQAGQAHGKIIIGILQ